MKKIHKTALFICLLQCLSLLRTYAATTYDWTGATSTDWNTPGNWKVGGVTQTTNYPGTSVTDIAQIGVANVTISRQATISNPITIASVIIGAKASTNTLTINAALTISGDFTQKNDANGNGVTTNLTGTGSITCNNFYAGDATLPPVPTAGLGLANTTYQTIVNFSSLSLTINQNLYLTTTTYKTNIVIIISYPSANVNNPTFNFNSGTISIGNSLQTVDSNDVNISPFLIYAAVSNNAQFFMNPAVSSTSILNLNGATPLSLDGNAGYVDFYGTNGGTSTVNYGGSGNQEVYTSSASYNASGTRQYANGLDRSPSMYQNLTFSGALTKKADAGNLTVGNNLTLAASSTEIVDFATNSPIVTIGGNLVSNSGTTLNQGGTGTMAITGTSNNAGTLNQTGSGNITFTGALTNAVTTGVITQSSTGAITVSGSVTNLGSISQGSSAAGGINVTGGLINGGTITQTGGNIVVNGNVTNSGTLTLGTANFNISGSYNNTGTYSQSTGTTLFNGSSAQTLQDGSSAGTKFNTVNFSGSGAKTMTSGAFYVSSTAVLTMIGSSTLAANGYLTLKSDSAGSATVAALPTGASITGNVNVQRFLSGGSLSHRSYRLLSSPVNQGSRIYSINYLINSTYLTGTDGTAGGFDKSGNPTIYLFRENIAPLYSTFLNSNYRGIANISSSPNYKIDIDGSPYNIPIGNGYLFFFRGNRNAAPLATETTTSYVPTNAILTATGVLNTDTISVKDWYTPASWNLGYTLTTGNDPVRGYNLVGNPYASSIDWDKFQTTSPSTGIYGYNVQSTIYVLDELTKTFGSYIAGSGGVGSASFVSNIISSGQGFLVVATCSCAKLTFTESAKTNTLTTGAKLLMGTPQLTMNNQYIRLQLTGKDSTVSEQTMIRFKDGAPHAYTATIDALYKPGFGLASLSSRSADQVNLSINSVPLPKQQHEVINLNVNANNSGIYTLKLRDIAAVPQLFDVWLMDAYKKDSLDMRQNKIYSLYIDKGDSTTFGGNRFYLVIRQNPAYAYRLINFTASKVSSLLPEVQITWLTKNEENYTRFTVERSIDNGKTFNPLGGPQAAGQGTYSFLDKSPVTDTNLYRLKQEDINNVISYSKVVTIEYSALSDQQLGNKINIYPNPVSSTINLNIESDSSSSAIYHIKFMTSSGIIVKEIVSPTPSWQGSIGGLLPGTYIVRVFNKTTQNLVGENKFVKL